MLSSKNQYESNAMKRSGVLNPQLRCCEWEIAITTPPVSPALSVGSLFQKVGRLLMVVVMMIVVLVITVVVDVIIMMVMIVISVMCWWWPGEISHSRYRKPFWPESAESVQIWQFKCGCGLTSLCSQIIIFALLWRLRWRCNTSLTSQVLNPTQQWKMVLYGFRW